MDIRIGKRRVAGGLAALVLSCCVQVRGEKRWSEYVNPFIGATTNTQMARAEHGLGKTFPGAATPWGMTQVSPNTITGGDNGSGYSFEHTTIEGFAMTQMTDTVRATTSKARRRLRDTMPCISQTMTSGPS